MQSRVMLHLRARLEERQAAVSELRALCHLRGHVGRLCDDLISAFNEAFNNVVIHAYRDRLDGTVDVLLLLDEDRAVIELQDSGRSFDLHAVPPPPAALVLEPSSGSNNGVNENPESGRAPNVEGLAEGGYGVHIIRSLMSEVSYHQEGTRNVLRMIKNFPHIPGSEERRSP